MMPWATPVNPSLALGILGSILDVADIPSSSLYANLLLPRPEESGVFSFATASLYEDRSAGLSFVPYLYPNVDFQRIADTVGERFFRVLGREGLLEVKGSYDRGLGTEKVKQLLMEQTLFDIEAAGVCLDRTMEKIEQGEYDIIGFTLTFETQLIASLAMARRIKERWPNTRIVFGGAACISGQGIAILKSYDFLDVVCLGEGDALIVPLVRALRGHADLSEINGIAYRTGERVHVTQRAEPIIDLEWIPAPDYEPYFQQKEASSWADTLSILLFETSRGCWWGEKHLCTFCGLNSETLTYRSKSARRVIEEITTLCDKWSAVQGLQAVDNIFDMRYFKELVPLLTEFQKRRDHPIGIFFEVKSNLKLNHFFLLAAAGIKHVQPGIESFSDHILQLMDKGANTMQQISFIKWANQVGVSTNYNVLMRNPGETVEDYHQMLDLVPFITHLQPPKGSFNIQLQRYSPYFLQPEKFAMYGVRPHPHYKEMFPDPNVDVEHIVYEFEFDHDELDKPDLVAARRDLTLALLDWQADYKSHRLEYYFEDGDVVIEDRRSGSERVERLRGVQSRIFSYIDQPHSFSNIAGNFPDIEPAALRSFLEWLVSQRFAYRHNDNQYLALPVRQYSDSEYSEEMEKHTETLKVPVALGGEKKPRELAVLHRAV
jgi:ribosomal peptide maturation radical SAM protein 1